MGFLGGGQQHPSAPCTVLIFHCGGRESSCFPVKWVENLSPAGPAVSRCSLPLARGKKRTKFLFIAGVLSSRPRDTGALIKRLHHSRAEAPRGHRQSLASSAVFQAQPDFLKCTDTQKRRRWKRSRVLASLEALFTGLGKNGTVRTLSKGDCEMAPPVFLNCKDTQCWCLDSFVHAVYSLSRKTGHSSEQFNVRGSTRSSHGTQWCFQTAQMVLLAMKVHL